VDPESVNQIVKAITSLHDGRTWKPETVAAVIAALAATGAATVTFILGRRQIAAAKETAEKQIAAAHAAAQLQIESAQIVAKQQVDAALETAKLQSKSAQEIAQQQIESAQSVARLTLAVPARQAWETQFRGKLASFLARSFDTYLHPDAPEQDTLTVATLSFEVSLMLDPSENVHRGLNEELSKLSSAATLKPRDPKAFKEATERVRAMAHFVLKG
jgi:hypothetical protein